MTGITRSAQEYIAIDISVVAGKLALVVMLVAVHATKQAVVARRGMAVCTGIPLPTVIAAVDRKKLLVVVDKSGGTPTRSCGVAKHTVSGEAGCLMIGVLCRLVVCQVAGNADGGGVTVVVCLVTLPAIHDFMALGEREKVVGYVLCRPVERIRPVAVSTLYRITCCYVVGIGGRGKVAIVTVNTGIAYPVKLEAGFGDVAGIAVGGSMCAQQREAIVEVQLHNIINQPAIGAVTAAAVVAYRYSVHIGVAGDTVSTGFRKNKRSMACTAVYLPVLPIECKTCGFMTKPAFLAGYVSCLPKGRGYFPTFRLVAGNTVLLQLVAMWVL